MNKVLFLIVIAFCMGTLISLSVIHAAYDEKIAKNTTCYRVHVRNATQYNAIIDEHVLNPGDEAIVFEQCLNEHDRMVAKYGDINLSPIIIDAVIQGKIYPILKLGGTFSRESLTFSKLAAAPTVLSRDLSFTLKEDATGNITVEGLPY